ncbi:MAG: HAD-IIIC family phosphatase, partial [Eggerthellaceae bacterium]|nr:HAD-IIIC family phosphatase [Eggerthellaceae bacterium]
QLDDSRESVDALLADTYQRFAQMWDQAAATYQCAIIQNNFEQPIYRLLGNRDAYDFRGAVNFTARLNLMFAEYAQTHEGFYLNDLNWISAQYGLQQWHDSFYWHMYKYAMCVPAIPEFAFNVANIIKSLYGKNKKVLALDLDNTLWGGVVGDDGPEGIEIGMETSTGQTFLEFQRYVSQTKKLGIMLAVDSKNEEENALAGLNKPECALKPDDFIVIKANWNPKDGNLREIAQEINVGIDSVVFVDDNPAERAIIRGNVPEAAVPEVGEAQNFISVIDRAGFFEATNFSEDDLKRNEMYKANVQRAQSQSQFDNYEDYLKSLEMTAVIAPFDASFESRIAQLTNKTNQFNLTTRRCSL